MRAGQGADLAIIDVKLPIQALVEQRRRTYLPAGRGLWNRANRRQNRR